MEKGQKVALALEIEPYYAEEARKRMAHGKTAPGKTLKEKVPEAFKQPQARDQAAAAVGISGKLVSAAKAIR